MNNIFDNGQIGQLFVLSIEMLMAVPLAKIEFSNKISIMMHNLC